MRCIICDKDDNSVVFDYIIQQFTPCQVCQQSIIDCLTEFEEKEEGLPW